MTTKNSDIELPDRRTLRLIYADLQNVTASNITDVYLDNLREQILTVIEEYE